MLAAGSASRSLVSEKSSLTTSISWRRTCLQGDSKHPELAASLCLRRQEMLGKKMHSSLRGRTSLGRGRGKARGPRCAFWERWSQLLQPVACRAVELQFPVAQRRAWGWCPAFRAHRGGRAGGGAVAAHFRSCGVLASCSRCLEKAMAPHSSTLAWKILWMEEPGRLRSMGLLRVRHN